LATPQRRPDDCVLLHALDGPAQYIADAIVDRGGPGKSTLISDRRKV